jgi:hypothetical protein
MITLRCSEMMLRSGRFAHVALIFEGAMMSAAASEPQKHRDASIIEFMDDALMVERLRH